MSPSNLRQHLDKLFAQLMLSSRRVDKTICVVEDAQVQARVRLEEVGMTNVDEVRQREAEYQAEMAERKAVGLPTAGAGAMNIEEWRLVEAVDKLDFYARRTLDSMGSMHEAFSALQERIQECLREIHTHLGQLDEMLKRLKMAPPDAGVSPSAAGTAKSSANSIDLFAIQTSAHAAAILDAEALAACNKLLEAVRTHSVKLEGAASDRTLRLQDLLASPTRKSPAERRRTAEIGMETFVEALCEAARRKLGERSHEAPFHLLRGCYPTEGEPPPMHRVKTVKNTYPLDDLHQGDRLAVRRLKKREAAAARLAATTSRPGRGVLNHPTETEIRQQTGTTAARRQVSFEAASLVQVL